MRVKGESVKIENVRLKVWLHKEVQDTNLFLYEMLACHRLRKRSTIVVGLDFYKEGF